MQARREAEAVSLIDDPVTLEQGDADTLSILALCLRAMGRYDRSGDIAERITLREPTLSLGWLLQGSAQVRQGRFRDAEASLRRCIGIEQALFEAWHYLGESLQAQGRWDEAIAAYATSAQQMPADAFNVALCHEYAGRIELAERHYSAVQRMMPRRADVLARLAYAQAMLCLHDREPSSSSALADVLDRPLADDDAPEPFVLAVLDLDVATKAAALGRHSSRIRRSIEPLPPTRPARRPDGRIHIAYLSADLGPHAVGELSCCHFAAHDRGRFRVSAYSLRSHQGEAAEVIRTGVDSFVECDGLGDEAVAEAIRADGVDVLIDMGGFTHGARPAVLARRPSPLQLGWLGFIHGHQAPWLDALLLDRHVWPGSRHWPYEDRIMLLEGCLFPGSPVAPGTRDRARFGLPEDVAVLASFNNTHKLSAPLIQAWSTILGLAPEAHLMVYVPNSARKGFLRQWDSAGGPAERLHMVEQISAKAQADRAASCDLFLDAFRYQGGATAMNAIGNGLPVLSRADGESPLARLSLSINRFLGMDELVCDGLDSYVELAAAFANDSGRLSRVRAKLQERAVSCGLFDPRRVASSIEQGILSTFGEPLARASFGDSHGQ